MSSFKWEGKGRLSIQKNTPLPSKQEPYCLIKGRFRYGWSQKKKRNEVSTLCRVLFIKRVRKVGRRTFNSSGREEGGRRKKRGLGLTRRPGRLFLGWKGASLDGRREKKSFFGNEEKKECRLQSLNLGEKKDREGGGGD